MNLDRARLLLSKLIIKDREANISVPFHFNSNQIKAFKIISEHYERHKWIRVICTKARRVGMSSMMDSLLFCHCLARPQAHAEIVAHLKEVSEKGLFRVPRDLGDALNEKAECCDVRTRDILFHHQDGESRLDIATAGSVGGGRGLTLTALHLSEAAQYPGSDSFLGILPAVSKAPDTIIALESTAFGRVGIGQTFYDFWNRAHKKGSAWNGYTPIFLSWLDDPACKREASEAPDAPATDLERELMKVFRATRGQIAWMRLVLEGECEGSEAKFCVTGDQRVSTQNGLVPIIEAQEGDETESGAVSKRFDNGVSPVVRVTTENGYTLRCTPNHPILTVRNGFQHAAECVGQRVRLGIPRFAEHICRVEIPDLDVVDVDESCARFLGYFVTDGSFYIGKYKDRRSSYHHAVSLVGDLKDQDVAEILSKDMERVIGRKPPRRKFGKSNCWELRAGHKPFLYFARAFGIFNETRPHRRVCVPEAIFRSPKNVVREFLRAAFEGDGSPSANSVRLFSNHPALLEGVQLLLLGFGISSRVSGEWLLMRGEEAGAFFDEVGFLGARKNSCVPIFKNRSSEGRNPCGVGQRPFPLTLTDQVVSVVPDGEAEVFDLTVEPNHQFVVSGITCHNSQEYPWTPEVAFVASGDPAFNSQELQYARRTIKPPLCSGHLERSGSAFNFIEVRNGKLLVYEKPRPKCWYYIGADCARGMEAETGSATGDFAAYVVLNGTTGKIAAVFSDWVNPEQIAEDLDKAGRWYNMAMVNIELTGNLGLWAQKIMRDTYYYPNLYVWRGKDDAAAGKGKRHSLGWETTGRTRDLLYSTFRGKLREGMKNIPGGLEISDEELLRQMDLATMGVGMRWEVEHGHDDVLMAALLAVVACAQYPPPNIANFKGNYLETKDSRQASVEAALKPQATLQTALKRDLDFILFRDKERRNHSVLGRI